MSGMLCFLWVFVLAWGVVLYFWLDDIAEWERKRNARWREAWNLGNRDRVPARSRPLDPLIETSRSLMSASMPESIRFYRLKAIFGAVVMAVAAVIWTIVAIIQSL